MEMQLDAGLDASSNRDQPINIKPRFAWVETTTVTLLALALCLWTDPTTQQFTSSYFPWMLLVPVLFGLFYGPYHGTCSGIACVIVLIGTRCFHHYEWTTLPVNQFLGLAAGGVLTDEVVHMWQRRVYRLESECQTQNARFAEFARNYQLLRMSHTRLEQKFLGNSSSLRRALFLLRSDLQRFRLADTEEAPRAAAAILEVFRECGYLQTAALHWTDASGRIATDTTLDTSHFLIQEALRSCNLVAVAENELLDTAGLLAVVPLVDTARRVWGIVTVYEIPYFAMKNKLLEGLGILGGHVGDILNQESTCNESMPAALNSFRCTIDRSLRDLAQGRIPTTLVSFKVRSRVVANELRQVAGVSGRCIDKRWVFDVGESESVVIVLLPITEAAGATQMAVRIKKALKDRLAETAVIDYLDVSIRPLSVSDRSQPLIDQLGPAIGLITTGIAA
jgi:polysaccharide biosynthesis protein PelD